MTNKRILVDLKPALDGFSGIPQESRLLFRGLQDLGEGFEVDGLLQHSRDRLAAPLTTPTSPQLDRIIQSSKAIASFDVEQRTGGRARLYLNAMQRRARELRVRWRALRHRPVPLAHFDAASFPDFVWRRFFEKSLGSADMDAVLAARYRLLAEPRNICELVITAELKWLQNAAPLRLDTSGYDALVAQGPLPAAVSPSTRLIVRYHDAVPVFLPHTIASKRAHQALHVEALIRNVQAEAVFACCSEATRAQLLSLFPQIEARTAVIHNIVSDAFMATDAPRQHASAIISNRAGMDGTDASPGAHAPRDYLLMVSTLEPRKNHALLLSAWERLRLSSFPELSLVLVGSKGWSSEPIEDLMKPGLRRGQVFHLTNVPARELGVLYQHAAVTVCPSVAEGFDYTGVEAMRSGGVVAASDIPVHREVYGGGAAYFNPYSEDALVATLSRLLVPDGEQERKDLVQAGALMSSRYTSKAILPQWRAFLTKILN